MQAKLIAGALLLLIGGGAFHSCCQAKVHLPAKVAAQPQYDEALAVLQSLSESQDDRQAAKAWRALGALYESRGLLMSASNAFERAKQAGERAELDLGRVLLKQGDLDGAKTAAEAGLKEYARADADAFLLVAQIYKAKGWYLDSRRMLEKARQHSDQTQLGRVYAAECDLLQLQRHLAHARRLCQKALKLQPLGDRERPATERILGLVYFYSGESKIAKATHERAQRAYSQLGMPHEAAWLREHVLDDIAEMTTDETALEALVEEFGSLLRDLRAAPEPLWWRISDAELRRADVLRKLKRWADATSGINAAVDAFQRRKGEWEKVPDYAAIFELKGMLARDQELLQEARDAFLASLHVLEHNDNHRLDTTYLKEEIEHLTNAIAQEHTHKTVDT